MMEIGKVGLMIGRIIGMMENDLTVNGHCYFGLYVGA